MAERRMFAKTIIDSDAFLDMPVSTQCLYFHLSMRADDDGFVNNPKKIQRMIGAVEDDLKLLIAKRFILAFESGVVAIKHWRMHNYIRKDAYTETKYKEEKAMLCLNENNAYTFGDGAPLDVKRERQPLTPAQQKRLDAKKESSLPYSFDYKIRQAFVGESCPICGCTMSYENYLTKPTVQHNTPISLGGKHEIDNISVICASCNSSIQNRQITEPYNTEQVKAVWECIGNVSGMSTQVRLGKDRIGKDRLNNTTTTTKGVGGVETGGRGGDEETEAAKAYISTLYPQVFGKTATVYEVDTVFLLVQILNRKRNDGQGEYYFTQDDRELLDIAFESAARAGKKNVSYIQGIYRNLMQRKIFTADAYWSDQYQRDNENSG